AGGLEAADPRRPEARTKAGVAPEGTIADHRVRRVGVDVEHRREIDGEPHRGELDPDTTGDALCQGFVAAPRYGCHRRHAQKGRPQPNDAAAFLIDGEE